MNPTFPGLLPLSPLLVLSLTVVFLLLQISFKRHHAVAGTVAVLGLNAALGMVIVQALQFYGAMPVERPVELTRLIVLDPFSLLYSALILVSALGCATLSHAYIDGYKNNREELYLLMIIGVMGALVMVGAHNLSSFFIGLELLSVPTYGMLAYTHERNRSLESGIKYMVLSATASSAILMGMAFLYAQTGSLDFQAIGMVSALLVHAPLTALGMGLMLAGMMFKLSIAPFHAWTPDVYQGAPAPATTFLATVSKVAMLGLAIRFFIASNLIAMPDMRLVLAALAVLSILLGNIMAVRQVNLKRLLGYSSIAHMGYILIAAVTLGKTMQTVSAVTIYIISYTLTSLGAFGVVTLMSSPYHGVEAESLADYRGLFWRRPILTAVLTVMMLSLAGIPLTVGFVGKFFIVLAAVQNMSWFLAAMIILGSAIGLYYYLKVIIVLYMTPPERPTIDARQHWGIEAGGIMMLLVTFLVLLLGIWPTPMLALVQHARLF